MKKHIIKILCLLITFVTMLSLTACGNKEEESPSTTTPTVSEQNKTDSKFDELSKEDRDKSIREILRNEFGKDIVISATNERVFIGEDGKEYYQLYYRTSNNRRTQCWVSSDGQVISFGPDTELNNQVIEYLTKCFASKLDNFQIACEIEVVEPINEHKLDIPIEDLLKDEFLSIKIRLIVDPTQKSDVMLLAQKKFDGLLNDLNGTCFIYFIDNPKEVPIDQLPYDHYDKAFKFGQQIIF